nr:exopolysaccharide biosynthesis protein [Rhodomicrobium sp. Az07]
MEKTMDSSGPEDELERTSQAVRRLTEQKRGQPVTVGELLDALEDGGFGVLMILFALPNAVIPGISFVLGAPVVLLGLQLASGRKKVWLPQVMRRQVIPPNVFEALADRVERFLVWIEKRARPRWIAVVSDGGERLLGLYIAIVAAFLMLPMPFGNILPAFGIAFMSVGIIEKDGKAASLGAVLGFLGILYLVLAFALGIQAFKAVLGML